MIRFTIPAVPVAQPRRTQRIISTKDGRSFAHNYTPKDHPIHAFRAAVSRAGSEAFPSGPLSGPVMLGALFIMPRPKSMTTKRGPNARVFSTKKPDVDNLMKSLADALNGIAFADDAQIAACSLRKTIAAADESPRVEVEVVSLVAPKPALEAVK